MDKASVNFSQGDENELTLLDQRMGDLEFLRPNLFIIKEKNIKVNGSGSPANRFLSTQLRFNSLQSSKQLKGFQFRFDFYHAVDEPVLIDVTKGFCFEKGRFCEKLILVSLQDFGDRSFTSTDFMAEIRADPDVGDMSHAEQQRVAFEVPPCTYNKI